MSSVFFYSTSKPHTYRREISPSIILRHLRLTSPFVDFLVHKSLNRMFLNPRAWEEEVETLESVMMCQTLWSLGSSRPDKSMTVPYLLVRYNTHDPLLPFADSLTLTVTGFWARCVHPSLFIYLFYFYPHSRSASFADTFPLTVLLYRPRPTSPYQTLLETSCVYPFSPRLKVLTSLDDTWTMDNRECGDGQRKRGEYIWYS